MRVVDINKALALAREDPGALARYDYVIDEGAWLTPMEDFLERLRRKGPATAEKLGVKA